MAAKGSSPRRSGGRKVSSRGPYSRRPPRCGNADVVWPCLALDHRSSPQAFEEIPLQDEVGRRVATAPTATVAFTFFLSHREREKKPQGLVMEAGSDRLESADLFADQENVVHERLRECEFNISGGTRKKNQPKEASCKHNNTLHTQHTAHTQSRSCDCHGNVRTLLQSSQ